MRRTRTLSMVVAAVMYCVSPLAVSTPYAGPAAADEATETAREQTTEPTPEQITEPTPEQTSAATSEQTATAAPVPTVAAEPDPGATRNSGASDSAVPAERGELLETGVATVYAAQLEGRITASGEPYSSQALTAAHRTLPMGTRLRVVNVANVRSVVVRVNDRWAGSAGRIINLSRRAAEELGLGNAGMANVRVELLARGSGDKVAEATPGRAPAAAASEHRLPARVGEREGTQESRCENEAAILGLNGGFAQSHVLSCLERRKK